MDRPHVKRISKAEFPGTKYPYRKDMEKQSLQDRFLTATIDSEAEVDIYLKNESVRRGQLIAYDNWSVLLYSEGKQYLLFKSAIMSIIPNKNLQLESDRQLPYAHTRVAEPPGPAYNYVPGYM